MSRSIHTTRRTFKKLLKKKFSSVEAKLEALKDARRQLRRKRFIKHQVLDERRRPAPPLAGTPICTIPIEIMDTGPFVHHAASPDDIRTVLSALPSTATEGIARLHLHLGKEYMDECGDEEESRRDPFTGRLSFELFPGVYGGDVLGTYSPQRGQISVYAYVYDAARLPLPRPLCEVYLRLHALKTLVHEVAHHHDDIRRVRRGRWLADRKANFEWYAEKMEHQWTQEVVLPYLQRAYPKETQALRRWVAHRGGLMLPLEFFAGDTRRTERNGLERLTFATSSAFENWVKSLPRFASLTESRLAFAWELHYADSYEPCLTILDRILAANPSDIPTLICKADTLVHLERMDEALACAETVLRLTPGQADAWEARGDVFEHRQDWHGLLNNCARWEATGKMRRPARRAMLLHRAIAHCGLDRASDMEATLLSHLAVSYYRSEETAKRRSLLIRKSVYRRAGKPMPTAEISKEES